VLETASRALGLEKGEFNTRRLLPQDQIKRLRGVNSVAESSKQILRTMYFIIHNSPTADRCEPAQGAVLRLRYNGFIDHILVGSVAPQRRHHSQHDVGAPKDLSATRSIWTRRSSTWQW